MVGQRQDDALGVGVVGDLVTTAIAKCPPDAGDGGRVGRQAVGVGPVLGVLDVGDRCVKPSTDQPGKGAGLAFFLPLQAFIPYHGLPCIRSMNR